MLHNFKSFLNENYRGNIKKITESSVDELVKFLIYEAVKRDVLVDKISRKPNMISRKPNMISRKPNMMGRPLRTEIFGTSDDINFEFNKEIVDGKIQYVIRVGFVHLLFSKINSDGGLYERVEKAFDEILKYNIVYEFMQIDFDKKYEQCAQNWMNLFETFELKEKPDVLKYLIKYKDIYGIPDDWIEENKHYLRSEKAGLLSLTNESKRMELFSLCKTNFISYREKYIKHFKEKLGKYPTSINKIHWFPTIEEAPELEETLRNVYQKMLKNPLAYVIYFKYVMDEELYTLQTYFDQGLHNFRSVLFFQKHEYNYPVSHTRLLSPDIVYWLYDLEEEGKIEQVLDKMVRAVERNPEKWFFNKKNYEVLPEYIKEKVKHLDRAKNTGLWDLKTKE
jgi:hypothetical protein